METTIRPQKGLYYTAAVIYSRRN